MGTQLMWPTAATWIVSRCALVIFLLSFGCSSSATSQPNPKEVNPIYTIKAHSLYDAGYQVGVLAKPQIQTWLQGEEMTELMPFVTNDPIGQQAFASLKRDNAKAFPEALQELKGLAKGAQVPLDWIWMTNLVPELESLLGSFMPTLRRQENAHCTDLFGHATNGSIVQGHNEDWSQEVKPLWYFVKLIVNPRSRGQL